MAKKAKEDQDAKVMKNMTPGQMVEYKKKGKKHHKPVKDEGTMDSGIVPRMKSKEKAHGKNKGKK